MIQVFVKQRDRFETWKENTWLPWWTAYKTLVKFITVVALLIIAEWLSGGTPAG